MWENYIWEEDDEPRLVKESSFTNHVSARRHDIDDAQFGRALVDLHKKEGCGLGLVVSGGVDKDDRPCVSYLRPGGIAHRSDALEVGDYIVSVNGIQTSMLRHDDIVGLLKNSGEGLLIEVEYRLPEPPQSTFSVLCKRVEVRLERDGSSFGFTLRGGAAADAKRSRPLMVTQIRPGSSADREGTMKIGDRVLAVNNFNVSKATLSDAMSHIRHTERDVTLLVEYDVSVMDAVQNASGPLLVEIDKTPGVSLGLTLAGAAFRGQHAICIQDIRPASIADRCGALHIGDEILSIDETSVEHMTVAEATQLLKCSTQHQIRIEILPVGNYTHTKAVIETLRKSNEFLSSNGPSEPLPHRTSNQNYHTEPHRTSEPNYATVSRTSNPNYGSDPHRTHNPHLGTDPHRTTNPNYTPVVVPSASAGRPANYAPLSYPPRDTPMSYPPRDATLSRNTHPNYVSLSCKDALGMATQLPPQQLPPQVAASQLPLQLPPPCGGASNYTCQGIPQMSDAVSRLSDIGDDPASLSSTSSGAPGPTYISNQQVCHTETTEVLLVSEHRGFGFTLHDSPFATEGLAEPPVIGLIDQRGVAERCGVLQEGDRIIAINGHYLENRTLEEANLLLVQAGARVALLVEFDVADSVVPSSGVFLVKLAKKKKVPTATLR